MGLWCGIDWAEQHHDVAVVDDAGAVVGRRRIGIGPAGFADLLELLGGLSADPAGEIPVAIETPRGLLPAVLAAVGFTVYPINPRSAARYRERRNVTGAKSDRADAVVLADILRTDRHAHRPLPADSELAQEIRVLARAHQDAVWDRQQATNRLRALLREFYPAALEAFPDLATPPARAVLLLAPTPEQGRRLRRPAIRAAIVRAGRRRSVDAEVDRIAAALRTEQLRQLPGVERAMGQRALALVRALDVAARNADELHDAVVAAFEAHPDAELITSLPGLGSILGARALAEIGDDRSRFAHARGVKAFAGTAPITKASGLKTTVYSRQICNRRLGDTGRSWALSLLTRSEGARAHYDRQRAKGNTHSMACRHLANRYFGILFHCLQTGQAYDESKAFPPADQLAA